MSIRISPPPVQQGSSNGSGTNRSPEPPKRTVPPDLLVVIVVSVVVLIIVLVISLRFGEGRPQEAPDAVKAPAVQATPAPTPMSTPTQSCNPATNYLDMISLLERRKQWGAVPDVVTEALAMKQLCAHARTVLHERALTAKLHVLLAEPVSVLHVAEQQQVVNHYRNLAQKAAEAGVSFPAPLEASKLAADAQKFLLSKHLLEEGYRAGEYTKADHDTLRLYKDVLYRMGWYCGQGPDSLKAEGLRLLAASYALEQELGITDGVAWAELVKYKGTTDERNWPEPAPTPLLAPAEGGS